MTYWGWSSHDGTVVFMRKKKTQELSPLSPLCEGSARRLSAGLEADSPQEPNWHYSVSRTMKNKFQLSHPVYGILKLYNFSCTVIIWHPHTLQSDHQDKSSSLLVFFHYHTVDSLHLFHPLPQPSSPLVTTNLISVSMSLHLFQFCFLDSMQAC